MYVSGREVWDNPTDIARDRSFVVCEDSLPPFKIAAFPASNVFTQAHCVIEGASTNQI
jgi:hypothetical protein